MLTGPPRVAVMGAGAVGCWFGGMLARAGIPVTLIGRSVHVEAIVREGLLIESAGFRARVPVSASTEAAAARGASLALLCVKTPDTEDAAGALAPHLGAGTRVVSLQNGVDNVERIRSAAGVEAVPAAVYLAVEMTEPGCVRHGGRGDLVIGSASPPGGGARRSELDRIAALFAAAGIPCLVSENIEADLWTKMTMNCAYNAISALTGRRYGRIAADPSTREVVKRAIEETVAVARAAGVGLPSADFVEMALRLAETIPGALSSTARDVARGRRTEIDSLNGYVARLGARLGVPAPVNATLHALVKALEAGVDV